MLEKEKMLNGLLYYADKDEILINERLKCKNFVINTINFHRKNWKREVGY